MKQFLVLCALVIATQDQDPPRVGEPLSLKMGTSVSLEDTDLSLTFSDVTHDSRCPKDVNCIVAGKAVVVLEVSTEGETTKLTFDIAPDGSDERRIDDLTVRIVALGPEPVGGQRMERSTYVSPCP